MACPDDPDAGGPDLGAAAGAMRDAWRAEEEEWARAAVEQWAHGRSLADVARELMHRGDTVAVRAGEITFTGTVTDVGVDGMRVVSASGPVDVQLGALALRVVARARSGGRRGRDPAITFRARLLEHEAAGTEVLVGSALLREELSGALTVGRDQVRVCDRTGAETYLPLAWVSWVRPASDCG